MQSGAFRALPKTAIAAREPARWDGVHERPRADRRPLRPRAPLPRNRAGPRGRSCCGRSRRASRPAPLNPSRSVAMRCAARRSLWRLQAAASSHLIEPAALEPGASETAPQGHALAHVVPDELVAVVADHGEDRALVDPEIVPRDPAERWIDMAVGEGDVGGGEAAVERVEESVP